MMLISGADSRYLTSLTSLLTLPGNVRLIDLPGNDSHVVENYDYDKWFDIFVPFVKQYENPIIVGHSFGGMAPLLFPELEDIVRGLVISNSAPCLWLEAAAAFAHEHQLPDLTDDMAVFTQDPNQETFNTALLACMPYYFSADSIEKGKQLFDGLPFAFQAAGWWQRKSIEINFNAKWIPQTVPTLIIGGEFDGIVPYHLFNEDPRFTRPNISKHCIAGAGHAPWIEQPNKVTQLFVEFSQSLMASNVVNKVEQVT